MSAVLLYYVISSAFHVHHMQLDDTSPGINKHFFSYSYVGACAIGIIVVLFFLSFSSFLSGKIMSPWPKQPYSGYYYLALVLHVKLFTHRGQVQRGFTSDETKFPSGDKSS